ncbi:MAG: MarC family protein [Gammaproteobacteria bacterium]|jgi:multiple antibiotic resistance protein|nr:MarC family protein [Gammaproteobacteria bacterium]
MEYWNEYARFFTALFVILDPFAAIPVFLSLTVGYTQLERNRIAWRTAITVSGVLIISALFGESILTGLGTSLASFRVGGGLILVLMALVTLHGQASREPVDLIDRDAIAIVPLAIPLMAGPGAISTVIIESHRGAIFGGHAFIVIGIILLVSLILWVMLRMAVPIGHRLGPMGMSIMNRLLGLILVAIGIEIMANGLKDLFPVLAG